MNPSEASQRFDDLEGLLRSAVEQIATLPPPADSAQRVLARAAKWPATGIATAEVRRPFQTKTRLYLAACAAVPLVVLLAAGFEMFRRLPREKPMVNQPKVEQPMPKVDPAIAARPASPPADVALNPGVTSPADDSSDHRFGAQAFGAAPTAGFGLSKDQPTSATAEQKVLTPAEAISLKSKEKVTLQFKVAAVQAAPTPRGGFGTDVVVLKDGGSFSVRLVEPARATILRLGLEPEKYFIGKVVRVTGVVQPDPAGSSFHIKVDDLTQFLVMKEQAAEQPQAKAEQPAAKVLTPAEAIQQKDKEQVTVEFEVAAVKMGWSTGAVPRGSKTSPVWWELKDGNNLSVVVKGRATYRLEQLRIDTLNHFTGKVIRVTGRVQGKEPSFHMAVDDLDQLEIVR